MLICQLTDLHVRPRGQAANRVSETNMLTERAFRAAAAFNPRPDIVIITGDLTECGLETEYTNLAAMLARTLTMPVYVVPGNHDRRDNFRKNLAHLPGVTHDPHFVQYAIEDYPVRLVMLDTLVPGASHGELSAAQLEWLDQTLAAQPTKPTLIGMHHPPFVCGIGHMDAINLRDSERFVAVVARHPQVQRIVCGHHHRPVVAQVAHAIASIAPSVAHQVELDLRPGAPSGFVFEPPGYTLHLWNTVTGIVSHNACVESFPGPFPFLTDPDYPGTTS